jgi:hypothetical protein
MVSAFCRFTFANREGRVEIITAAAHMPKKAATFWIFFID